MKDQRDTQCDMDMDKEDRRISQVSSQSYYSQKYLSEKNEGDDNGSILSLCKSLGNQKYESNTSILKGKSCGNKQGGIRNQERIRKTQTVNQNVNQLDGKVGQSKKVSADIKIILTEAFKPFIDLDRVSQEYHEPFYVPSLQIKQNSNRLHNGHIFKDHNLNIYDPSYDQCVMIGFVFVVVFIIFAIIPAGAIISVIQKTIDLGIFAVGIGGVILEFLWENLL